MSLRSPQATVRAAPVARGRSARSWLPALLALGLLCACRRSTETWQAELQHGDPWRRRMAAHALGRVPEDDVETAFRALATRLLEMDLEVRTAMIAALRELAARRPDLPARALEVLAPERQLFRAVMAELLLELELRGDPAAGARLATYLEGELHSGQPARVQAAEELQRRRTPGEDEPSPR